MYTIGMFIYVDVTKREFYATERATTQPTRHPTGAPLAYGYCRVSTAGQALEGVSLDIQRARITAWCLLHAYALKGVFVEDGRSGDRAANRPALQGALAAVCAAGRVLVV
jgi:hypothetical protein